MGDQNSVGGRLPAGRIDFSSLTIFGEVLLMVTHEELYLFATLIVAIIALLMNAKRH